MVQFVVFALSCLFKADPVDGHRSSPLFTRRIGRDETASVPRRLGLRAENCTSGACLTVILETL